MATDTTSAGELQNVATGQRLMILALVVNIFAYIAARAVDPIVGLGVGIIGLALAITGMIQATSGLGFSTPRKVLYVIGLFIPLVAIIVLALVSGEATKALRANGYKVGFFGAKGG
jgi:hypothetical protein